MNTTNPVGQHRSILPADRRQRQLITAAFLVGIGVVLLAAQLLQATWINLLILPALGLAFIAWGILTRNPGLEVPGGILLGLGAALMLIAGNVIPEKTVPTVSILMFGFALGFVLVIVLFPLAGGRAPLWPVFPALALAGVGLLFLAGEAGFAAMAMIGQLWPIALILAGAIMAFVVLRRR